MRSVALRVCNLQSWRDRSNEPVSLRIKNGLFWQFRMSSSVDMPKAVVNKQIINVCYLNEPCGIVGPSDYVLLPKTQKILLFTLVFVIFWLILGPSLSFSVFCNAVVPNLCGFADWGVVGGNGCVQQACAHSSICTSSGHPYVRVKLHFCEWGCVPAAHTNGVSCMHGSPTACANGAAHICSPAACTVWFWTGRGPEIGNPCCNAYWKTCQRPVSIPDNSCFGPLKTWILLQIPNFGLFLWPSFYFSLLSSKDSSVTRSWETYSLPAWESHKKNIAFFI